MTKTNRSHPGAGLAVLALTCVLVFPLRSGADDMPGVTGRDKLYDVEIQGSHVWIVGFPGVLLHSADGGRKFQRQGPKNRIAWLAVDFSDHRHGVVVGRGGTALKTTDGGTTWEKGVLGTTEPIFDVACPDSGHCFAVGNFAAAVRSTDGGGKWEAMQVAPEGEDPSLNGIAFKDASTGYAVGEFGLVARTLDGGATWERIDDGMNMDNNFGVTVLGDGSVVVVGSFGLIQVGRDNPAAIDETDPVSAMTFSTVKTGVREHLFRVTASGGSLAVSGAAGTLMTAKKADGPWTVSPTPTYQWMAMVAVDDSGHGFALGGLGTLLETNDNGVTWKQWEGK